MSRDLSRLGGKPGITLIELLVAISVSTLIMGVGLSVYLTLSASLRRQHDTRLDSAAAALDILRHDLASCVQASFSNTPSLEVNATQGDDESPDLSTLTFCSGDLNEKDDDFSRMEVKRIRYTLQTDGDDANGQALQRETVTLWGAEALGAPASNALLRAVNRFEVTVLDGNTWTNRWVSRPNRSLPRAARIRLDWASARTTETASVVVFIPAGNSVLPRAAHSP